MKLTYKAAGYDFNGKENNPNGSNRGVRFEDSAMSEGNGGPDGRQTGDADRN